MSYFTPYWGKLSSVLSLPGHPAPDTQPRGYALKFFLILFLSRKSILAGEDGILHDIDDAAVVSVGGAQDPLLFHTDLFHDPA